MKKKITFEAGMEELEGLVRSLESGQMPLEESFKAYERAVELRDALNKLLDESDKRIRVLTESGETELDSEGDA
ncbi:MAG: exodeoxyribonuclease VII small subunit [Clostridia bacterium]|nr:exodeoxyribonuclease VII small subunit [Clostridia bacterium]